MCLLFTVNRKFGKDWVRCNRKNCCLLLVCHIMETFTLITSVIMLPFLCFYRNSLEIFEAFLQSGLKYWNCLRLEEVSTFLCYPLLKLFLSSFLNYHGKYKTSSIAFSSCSFWTVILCFSLFSSIILWWLVVFLQRIKRSDC
jgi:hypothetical protein